MSKKPVEKSHGVQPAAWCPVSLLSPLFIRPSQININNVSINNIMMPSNLVSFHQTVPLASLLSNCLSLSTSPLFFFLLSVQTATHSPAQSEWGSYADHFFHL